MWGCASRPVSHCRARADWLDDALTHRSRSSTPASQTADSIALGVARSLVCLLEVWLAKRDVIAAA